MSIQPPKIDNRTYEDIVEQTVKLVQHYTVQESSELVDNQADLLRDRTLAEDIKDSDGKIIAAGTLIDEQLAAKIAKLNTLKQINVKVKGWYKQTIDSDPNNPKSNSAIGHGEATSPSLALKIQNPKSNDAGLALIRIFGRMAATVSDRLNQVPEKNFLAFLDLLGTQILPPQPARVPLTFYLASGVPENTTALVPAYTQISAPPVAGEAEEVVFETESDVLVTTVQLQAVFVRQPSEDKYSNRTLQATGSNDAFWAFEGDTAIEHSLYLACEQVLSLSEIKTVTLNIYSSQVTDWDNLPLTWSYWDGIAWKSIEKENKIESNYLQVTFKNLPAVLLPQTVDRISAKWLKAELNSRFNLSVDRITASVDITNSQLKLDQCFFNTVPLDLNKDFYPFGEQPRFNDTFYLASKEIFSKPGVAIVLNIQLSEKQIKKDGGVEIAWEFYNGSNWQKIGESSVSNPAIESQANFSDRTQAFTQSGEVILTIPNIIQPVTINGVNNYWLRARIITGNYGTETTYRQREKDGEPVYVNEVPIYELVPATFAPPSIQYISLKYSFLDVPLSNCLSYNNFTYRGHSTNFQPFITATDESPNPTLYLGFDRPFPNRAIALYFQVENPTSEELSAEKTNLAAPRLVWEYFNGKNWTKLNVIDETAAFSDRGLIKFIGPSDFQATQEFNQTLYWLRVRWEGGDFRVQPRLRRILTNTIWASQTTTLQNEILGSSNGNPSQTFRTVKSLILPGQQLEVQEQKIPPTEEQKEIENLEGKDAITIVRDEKGEVETVWVRWHEVSDFYESESRDRHYTLNRLTGEIQFGDGKYGLIPPQGRNNIRMVRYKTDGGAKGNKPAATINQLKTTIPYIDRVANLEAAAGGSDREPIDRVKERGQKFIRHRNRAVAVQDFEDLAYEASPDIARVKAIAPTYEPLTDELWLDRQLTPQQRDERVNELKKIQAGLVKLFIVPRNDSAQPIPSLALIDRVETYLRDRASPILNLWVGSPQWLEVSVTAEVVPTSLEVADTVRNAVIQSLETFLHPLTGGVSGQGWEFGREPHESDFYSLIEAIDGVDYVRSLSIPELRLPPELFLIYSGSHNITIIGG